MRSGSRSYPLTTLLLGIALCAAVYVPGLRGDFIFDDGPNIVQNERLQTHEISVDSLRTVAVSSDAGTLKRPVSMLSFWANYYTTGLDPLYFKITNLVIHLLNGIGLFFLARLVLRAFDPKGERIPASSHEAIAIVAGLLWLLHPLNVTSVLYVVQRMTSLSATFTILGLVCYLLGRHRLTRGQSGFPLILLGLVGCGALAILSKENGILLPLYMAAIELGLLRFSGLERDASRKLKAFFFLTVAAPLIAAVVFVALDPNWLTLPYATRSFTLVERLLTEARVLWLYLAWLFVPTRAALGIFHDDVATSHGLLDPWTTALAIAGILVVCSAAIRLRDRTPMLAFAVLWYLAGHVLESSVIALELVHEHRNYLPMFGPLLAAAYALWRVSSRFLPKVRLALPALFLAAISAVTLGRSLDWSNLQTLQLASARDHPNSVRSNYEAGIALGNVALRSPELANQVYDQAKSYFDRAVSLDGTAAAPFFGMLLLDASAGRGIDETTIDRLSACLLTMPSRFTLVEPFRALIDWIDADVVALPEAVVVRLFESALGNPTIDSQTRAMLFALLSRYWHMGGNVQEAVRMAIAAVEEQPSEPAHHVSLARLAIIHGNFALAASEIDAANRADTLGRWALETRRLADDLSKAVRVAEASPDTVALP